MRWPAVALAFLLSLAVGLGDLAASILVVPPGVTTLSIHIFGLLHYGVEDQVAGICLALVGLLAVLAAAAWGIMKRGGERGTGGGG
jgi:iron(III) transport system permease protein